MLCICDVRRSCYRPYYATYPCYLITEYTLTKSSLHSQDQAQKNTPNFQRDRFFLNTFYFIHLGLSSPYFLPVRLLIHRVECN